MAVRTVGPTLYYVGLRFCTILKLKNVGNSLLFRKPLDTHPSPHAPHSTHLSSSSVSSHSLSVTPPLFRFSAKKLPFSQIFSTFTLISGPTLRIYSQLLATR